MISKNSHRHCSGCVIQHKTWLYTTIESSSFGEYNNFAYIQREIRLYVVSVNNISTNPLPSCSNNDRNVIAHSLHGITL